MRAWAIHSAAWATVGRRYRPASRQSWVGLGLLAILLLAAGGWFCRGWTPWPVRASLPTRGPSSQEYEKRAVAGRPAGISWPEAFSPDGTVLVVSDPQGLTLWDAVGGQERATWTLPEGRRAYQGAFSPDGRTFVALSWDGVGPSLTIDLIDAATGRVRASLPTSGRGLVHGGLAFASDARNLRAMVYQQKALVVLDYDVASGREASRRTLSCIAAQDTTHASSDGQLLAFAPVPVAPSGRPSTDVVIWDVEQDRETARLPGNAEVTGVAFSPDGRSLAIGRHGGSVEVWDLGIRRLLRTLQPHDNDFKSRSLRFAPDGSTLASHGEWSGEGMTMNTVRRRIAVLRGDVSWRPPRELVLLDTDTGRRLLRTEDEFRPGFSPDNRTLATSHRDGAIRLRDLPGR